MSRRATFAALAALAAALPCAALPLGLRLTQAAVTQAASAKEKDPLLMTEEEAYEAYAPDTAYVIDTTLLGDDPTYIALCGSRGYTNDDVNIDWGDGTQSSGKGGFYNTPFPHTYAKHGIYVVRVKKGIAVPSCYEVENDKRADGVRTRIAIIRLLRWGDDAMTATHAFNACTNLRYPLPRWGKNIKSSMRCFVNCKSLPGPVPDWGENMEDLEQTYNNCVSLTGGVPQEWPPNAWRTEWCFYSCSKLTGPVPQDWGNVTRASVTFGGCSGLTGQVPAWGAAITSANSTFQNCSGLTGDIPAWGDKIKNAEYCYYNCKGLTGAWTDDPAELMPTNITSHGNCVSGASDAVRRLFYSDWGGYKEKPTE